MNTFTKQILIIFSIVILSVLINTFINGKNGILKLVKLKQMENNYKEKISLIKRQNKELAEQTVNIKTDKCVIEQHARKELGMIRANEIEYNFILSKKKPKMVFTNE